MPVATVILTHFAALLVFGLFVSIALACLTRRSTAERIRYAAWSLALFVGVGVGIAWLMYPFSR